MKAFATLLGVELKLSLRDMNMPIFALAMPAVVMAIIGIVFGSQPAFEGAPYSFVDQSVSAVAVIAVCAGGFMGLPIMIASSRSRKVFKRFFVTPVGVEMILGVQLAVYVVYATVSALLVFGIAQLFFGAHLRGSVLLFAASFLLVMGAMFGIGLLVGGVTANERQANLAATLLYFPMLLLSGVTIPYETLPKAVQMASDLLPLTQGVKLLKATSLGLPLEQAALPALILAIWAVVCLFLAGKLFKWE